jgi:hypothetical protein
MVGYKALNALTIFLQFGGMAVLMEGLVQPGHIPNVVGRATAVANIGALGGGPMKNETGQVRVISMAQSSTSQFTAPARDNRGRGSPGSHCSHDKKNCLESW